MKLGEREGQVATSKHVVFCCWERKGGGWLLLVCVCLAPSGRIVMAFVINRIDEQSKFEIFYFAKGKRFTANCGLSVFWSCCS